MGRGFIRVLLLLAVLGFIVVTFTPSRAADYSRVGVRPGDTADYKWTEWSFSSGQVDRTVHILIVSVTGTQVLINRTNYYLGGGISSREQLVIDVSTHGSVDFGSPPFIVAPGLQTGDPIYSGTSEAINDTGWRNVLGASRECSHYREHDASYADVEYSWDQATGLMFYLSESANWDDVFSFHASEMELTATSLWSADVFPVAEIASVVGGLGIVLVVAVAIAIFRSRRIQREAPPLSEPEVAESTTAPHLKRCMKCGADLAENATYCLMCGEPIYYEQLREEHETVSQPVPRARSHPKLIGKKCMVCALPVNKSEEALRCPHCRNIAHMRHMLEWLHVHDTCPVCGKHVMESQLLTLRV